MSDPRYAGRLRKADWAVITIPLVIGQHLVELHHYAGGAANTATYRHGLIRRDAPGRIMGAAIWIPPTKSAALATYPEDWRGVLALSRFVIAPDVPKNAATFLLARSRKAIDRRRWPCLVTYADEWQGHDGLIYRLDGWEYQGKTAPEPTWVKEGQMISRKAGPKTRTAAEMAELGAECIGSFSRHKFTRTLPGRPKAEHRQTELAV